MGGPPGLFSLSPEANHLLQIGFCSGTLCYSFSSPWTIVFQRSFKAEFPLNAVIAYSSCKGQTLWEMLKRLPLSLFFLSCQCTHFLSGASDVFVSWAKDTVSLWGRDCTKQIKIWHQRHPGGKLPSLSSQFRWQDFTLTPAHLISSERNFIERKKISSAWSKPDKHDYNAIKPIH